MSSKPEPADTPAAIELDLKYPITSAAGTRIERLSLRRARRADLRAATQYSKEEFEQETFLFARLAGLTMEDINALDLEDNNALAQRFRGLLGGASGQPADPATGG